MVKLLVIIAGMPASGKTTFAKYLSQELRIPLICKDRLKEILWERMKFDGGSQAESQKYGGASYDLSFHFCEELMKANVSFIFESNLGANCPPALKKLVHQYDYNVVTVVFEGDPKVIHRRFMEREGTNERHPGLVSGNRFASSEEFEKRTAPCSEFSYGDHIIRVDTTDFKTVSYEHILETIRSVSV